MFKLKTFPISFEFNGKSLKASVSISAELDHIQPEDTFTCPEDIEAIRSGKFELLDVEVLVSFGGMEVTDYLGAVCVQSGWQAAESEGRKAIYLTVEEYTMGETAVEDLKKRINHFLTKLEGAE